MNNKRICPWWLNFVLDNPLRNWLFPAEKLLREYLKPRMVGIDFGCGGGIFSVAGAKLVGSSGKIVALDIQERMLEFVREKALKQGVGDIVETHLAQSDDIGIVQKADFALAVHMVHETPDIEKFFRQVKKVLKPGAYFLVAEPRGHVSQGKITEEIEMAVLAGFTFIGAKKINFISRGFIVAA